MGAACTKPTDEITGPKPGGLEPVPLVDKKPLATMALGRFFRDVARYKARGSVVDLL